jgi:hypothetical protein
MSAEEQEEEGDYHEPMQIWVAEENTGMLVRDPEAVEAAYQAHEGASNGEFFHDYGRNCSILGILPHPKLTPPTAAEAVVEPVLNKPSSTATVRASLKGQPAVEGVKELRVSGWVFDYASMTSLTRTFNTCGSVTCLRLFDAALDLPTLKLLADSLEHSSLLKLYLDFNPVEEVEAEETEEGRGVTPSPAPSQKEGRGLTPSPAPLSIFASFCAPSSPLQLLSLRGNAITTRKARGIFDNLRENKTLLSLNLWGNELLDPSMPELAHALLVNKTITHLSVSKNQVSDEGATSLLRALTAEVVDKTEAATLKKQGINTTAVKGVVFRDPNQALKVLNLGHNHLGDEGCLKVLMAVCPEARPGSAVVEEAKGRPGSSKKGRPGSSKKNGAGGKECVLQKVVLSHNRFSPDMHQRLTDEAKLEVQDVPASEEDSDIAEEEEN